MGQVVATTERVLRAPADVVRAALADYATTRPAVLPEQYSQYRVDAGGHGAGTRVRWWRATPTPAWSPPWTVQPADAGVSTVRARTTWTGAGGIGGFFERTFAPKGLARSHQAFLERLEHAVTAG